MNEHTKLAIAFIAGVALTALVTSSSNKVETPVVSNEDIEKNEPQVTSSDKIADEENTATLQPSPVAVPAKPTPVVTPTPQPIAAPQPKPAYPYTATVSYLGTRFEPNEATIIVGGSVIFRNDSNEKMWIASNFHPSHSAYRETSEDDCAGSTFDQCSSVGPGGTWFFVFNKEGTWRYHNEEKPVMTGSVRVLSKEDYDKLF